MTQDTQQELLQDAARYIWWEAPEKAIRRPIRVVAQVMNIGDYDDVQRMLSVLGADPFKEAIRTGEPGWFTERSWGYWCYRLGITEPGDALPPIPQRVFE
jgi:hypothetical protein